VGSFDAGLGEVGAPAARQQVPREPDREGAAALIRDDAARRLGAKNADQ